MLHLEQKPTNKRNKKENKDFMWASTYLLPLSATFRYQTVSHSKLDKSSNWSTLPVQSWQLRQLLEPYTEIATFWIASDKKSMRGCVYLYAKEQTKCWCAVQQGDGRWWCVQQIKILFCVVVCLSLCTYVRIFLWLVVTSTDRICETWLLSILFQDRTRIFIIHQMMCYVSRFASLIYSHFSL